MKAHSRIFAVLFYIAAVCQIEAQAAPDSKPAPGALRGEAIDWTKAQGLHDRFQRGDKLSPEELAYYNEAREARGVPPVSAANNPSGAQTPVGPTRSYTPLTELGQQRYEGQSCGLYGGGSNVPPKEHAAAAQRESAKIRPLDVAGKADDNGKIVLLSLGMSNTTMEFSRFKQHADADPLKSPRLILVDGAQGGQDAQRTSDPENRFWTVVEDRLKAAGVTPAQVQIIWLKQAVMGPSQGFAVETPRLQGYLEKIVNIAKQRYPNLRIAYLSSRIYAGYATTRLNPEPYAYESAFAVRGLIQEQMNGAAKLNFDSAHGVVNAPLLMWGPYLWADGKTPRQSDGLFYAREDLAGDGTHPSDSGRKKVADLLLKFFKTDANARVWFLQGEPAAARSQ